MRFFFWFPVILFLAGCTVNTDLTVLLRSAQQELDAGNLTNAINLADSVKLLSTSDRNIFLKADSVSEIARRIRLDFSLTHEQVLAALEKRAGLVTTEQIAGWENRNWLESRMIDGVNMYFNRSVSNLILLRNFHSGIEPSDDDESIARRQHTEDVLKASDGHGDLSETKKIVVTYTIRVQGDAVPENETARCWLPYPKSGHSRQQGIKLLRTSQPDYVISPDTATHSTIYMEKEAEKGKPVVFSLSYEYESSAQWFNPAFLKSSPYNKESGIFKKFTSEQLPHISFNQEIRRLADSICGTEDDPVQCVISTWRWFKENIPWTGAIEYSIIPDIPVYACTNRRGDCGIQTLMFMSILRYRGIPVRWQSGWKVPPFGKNLHDWCEVYFEGTGWVPVDVSYDLQKSDDANIREFFVSGIDAYRLIVNDGIAGSLYPEKVFLRSEPYDFQRGEVEWKGGNLYFDKWDYEMMIEYR